LKNANTCAHKFYTLWLATWKQGRSGCGFRKRKEGESPWPDTAVGVGLRIRPFIAWWRCGWPIARSSDRTLDLTLVLRSVMLSRGGDTQLGYRKQWQNKTGRAGLVSGPCWRMLASAPWACIAERCEDLTPRRVRSTLTRCVRSVKFVSVPLLDSTGLCVALNPVTLSSASDLTFTTRVKRFDRWRWMAQVWRRWHMDGGGWPDVEGVHSLGRLEQQTVRGPTGLSWLAPYLSVLVSPRLTLLALWHTWYPCEPKQTPLTRLHHWFIIIVRLGVIPSAFAWVIASSGTWRSLWLRISCFSWWLSPPRWLGATKELWHVLVIVRGWLRWLWGVLYLPWRRAER
jgi:hypothetical protein